MKKYEYKTERFEGDVRFLKLQGKKHESLEQFLNRHGSEGWKVIRIEGNIIELNAHVLFMREIQDPQVITGSKDVFIKSKAQSDGDELLSANKHQLDR